MKRFLSMLATLVLVGQSVVTPAVYAMQGASESEESVSEAVVETTIDESDADDGSSDDEVVADSTNDAEESAELEETADVEESAEVDNSEISEEPEITEEDETSEVVESEIVEETDDVEEISTEDEESSIEEPVSYGKSFSSEQQEKSWTEISENRLVVTAIDSLGAFPEGTKMVVKAVEEEHVFDLVNDAIDANVTKVKAVDITFWYNEEEVQPEQPINVKISALNMAEPQTVVHIDAEYNDEKIEVGEADVEEINSEINGKTAEFEAESFSIYAIASVDRLQVNFKKADGSVLASGVIRNTADLESFIYYPEVSDLGENEIFRGWNNSSEYTTGTSEVDVKAEIESKYDELVANEDKNFDEIDFYAMIFNKYTITYQDENGAVILKTDEALFKAGEGGNLPYLISMSYVPNKPNQKFEGWKVVAGEVEEDECQNTEKGIICEDNKSITIKGDLTLNANVLEGHWLVFNENGKWATYVAPQFVETEANTEAPLVEMKRPGFSFDGWFEGTGDDAPKFTFGQKLTTGTTVYAHWTTGTTADYTVLIRKQNVSGSGYDFVESVTVEDAAVGSTPGAVNVSNGKVAGGTYNGEVGFKFKNTDQASKTVATEGNTVVNVYYDRNTITFNFNVYDYTYAPTTSNNGTQYGLVNGKYVEIYKDGNSWYTERNWDWYHYVYSNVYEGTRYTRSNNRSWNEYKTMEGLYGSTLADNDYTWPEEYDWYSSQGNNGNPTGTRTTFLDAFLPTSSETTVNFYADDPEGSNHIYFYKQNADGNGYTLANTVNTDANGFNLSDKYNGFECVAWNTSNNTSNWNEVGELMNQNGQYYYDADPKDGGYQTASIGSNGLHIYFDRKEYSILFNDGAYVDGNGNPIDDAMNRGKLYEKENITYGKNISSYLDEPAENLIPAGYVFGGWYTDDAGTALYSGNTMPEGLTLYAKWIQKQYRVFLHPNADEDSTLDWGSDTQAMNFRVSYGTTVSTPTGKRSEYEFIGWFTDDETFKNPFNSETRLTDANTADYNKETDLTDPTDKWGNANATENHDIDRSRITKKLDLYGKWRSKLEGASGMNIIYYAGEGSDAPKDEGLYLDLAEALAGPAATAPNGKQFKYWVVQKWNGSEYEDVDPEVTVYPGETFEVLKANAKKEANSDNTPENPSYTYTIQLRAEYKTLGEQEVTSIQYCPNYDGAEECTDPETIDVDAEFTTTGEIFTRDGYTFSGWNTQADGKGTDFGTGVSGLAADNLGVEENKVNVLYAVWNINSYDYTVEYYYNDVKDETKTETGNAEFNGTITTYTDKVEFGYTLSGAEGLPLTITANPENNIIKVYYVVDEEQTKEVSYTIEFYQGEELKESEVKTGKIQVLEEEIAFDGTSITEGKYEGYKLDRTDPATLPEKVASGDVVKAYYVAKDYTITFVNYDGTVLQSGDVAYGETPVYSGETPTKEGEGYEYTHSGWNPDIEPVTTGATYTAKYSAVCATGYHDQRLEGNNAVAGRVNPTVTSTTTEDPICVNDEKKTGVECTQGNKPAHSHYAVTTGAGSWNGQMYVGEDCPWECDNGYHKDGNVCKANGGGGGGGSTPSDPYICEDLPDNAVANNTDKPNKRTTYTYDEDTSKVCTFQCKSGYTRDKENKECVKSENPGGGNGGDDEEEIELGGQVSDKCSVEGSNRSAEEIAAYLYACENDITTIRDINKARLGDFLTRAEMAKMVSVFATKELGMKPNTSKDCSNFAESIAHYNQEMKDYMVMSCQLEVMGIHTTNYQAIPDFMPSKRVSRAEFGTILSRVLWGNKYEGTNENYYINHLNALKESNIITNINPNITEYRAWVFLMLYRSVEAIKIARANNNESVEQQVNEELQEEGKAETGLVVEYDSGSVVPDMATLTESGTLTTGAVAEIESGSVVETQTGATTALTGEDISKEVSAETGTVVETGSVND